MAFLYFFVLLIGQVGHAALYLECNEDQPGDETLISVQVKIIENKPGEYTYERTDVMASHPKNPIVITFYGMLCSLEMEKNSSQLLDVSGHCAWVFPDNVVLKFENGTKPDTVAVLSRLRDGSSFALGKTFQCTGTE